MNWNSTPSDLNETEIEPGPYNFLVTEVSKKISSKGNEMIEVHLKVKDSIEITDFFVFGVGFAKKKARQLFLSTGLINENEEVELPWNNLNGAEGRVLLSEEEFNGSKKLKAAEYLISQDSNEPDDIPF